MIRLSGIKSILFLITALLHLPSVLYGKDSSNVLEVYLKENVINYSEKFYVSDIVDTPSKNIINSLKINSMIPIEKDRLIILPLRKIRAALANQYDGPIILVGNRVTIIPGNLFAKDKELFLAAFAQELGKIFENENMYISVEFISIPEYFSDNVSDITFKIQKQARLKGIPRSICSVTWKTDTGTYNAEGVFDVIIHACSEVVIPKNSVHAGEILSFDNVIMKEVDLADFPEELLIAEDFFPMKAKINLEAGMPIFKNSVTKNIIVRAGERINITFQRKNLLVMMQGRALSSGSFDEKIRVRPDGTVNSFQGNVSGEKEVHIEFR